MDKTSLTSLVGQSGMNKSEYKSEPYGPLELGKSHGESNEET